MKKKIYLIKIDKKNLLSSSLNQHSIFALLGNQNARLKVSNVNLFKRENKKLGKL